MSGKITGKFKCCNKASIDLDKDLITDLNSFCLAHNLEVEVVSGVRCPECNKKAGGKENSAHPIGHAIDIKTENSNLRFLLLCWFMKKGYSRFGIAKTFTHIDNADKVNPKVYVPRVIWIY